MLVIKVKTTVGKWGIQVLESPCPGDWEGGEVETGEACPLADMSTHVPGRKAFDCPGALSLAAFSQRGWMLLLC